MNGDAFYETFFKVYDESGEPLSVFKTAHGILMLGEAAANEGRRVIGMGITPDTFIGIRLCRDECFYIRETDSEMMYECEKNKLFEYRENDWSRPLFHLLGQLCGSINISGAQILFHKECGTDFAHYAAAMCYGFSNMFCSGITASELLRMILPDDADFVKNVKQLLCLDSKADRFSLIENRVPVYIPEKTGKYVIILALTGEKAFENPISNREKNDKTDEIKTFEREENNRVTIGAALLKKGDMRGFGKVVKESAEEYLGFTHKRAEKTKILFGIASELSDICGVYENRGIFAFADKDETDDFIDKLGEMYEKRAGEKPEFYICAPSGTESVKGAEGQI